MSENVWYIVMESNGGKYNASGFPPNNLKRERKGKERTALFLFVYDLFIMFMKNPYYLKLA